MNPTIEHPRIFISYAWAEKEYQDKVLSLATDLMHDGVDVVFDKWSLKEGNDTYAFMEHCVTDSTITNVLILLDPMYEKKANERAGGVGTETQIISAEVYNQVTQDKFLPVIFKRHDDGSVPKPAYLKGLLHFDLSEPERYDDEYQRLVRRLYGIDTYQKPDVGSAPAWLEVTPTVSAKTRNEAEALKKKNIPDTVKLAEYRMLLAKITDKLATYGNELELSSNISLERYLEITEAAIPIRDEILQMFLIVPYIDGSVRVIAECLEELSIRFEQERHYILSEIRKTYLHELFIYLIAIYYKTKNYDALSYTINKTYFGATHRMQMDGQSFRIFYDHNENLDKALNKRDKKNYYSGTAAFWMEHINTEICSKSDFVFADELCFNAAVFIENYDDTWYWFPVTYVYDSYDEAMKLFSIRLKSREYLAVASKIFGYSATEEFKKKFIEVEASIKDGKLREYRYNSSFESAPIICYYIKADELGIKN